MLSSISNQNPGPTWLDRIRFSKGLPAEDHSDLEHLLIHNTNPNPNSNSTSNSIKPHPNSTTNPIPDEKPKTTCSNSPQSSDLSGKLNTILSDLFVMGSSTRETQRVTIKVSRKQKTPKPFAVLVTEKPPSTDNSVVVVPEVNRQVEVAEEDKLLVNLAGYSREDVMIIDTSATVWKSEKLIYRKGSVWKIKEKKSKFKRLFGCRKKRKASLLDRESEGKKKKKKKKKKKQKICLSARMMRKGGDARGEECGVLSEDGPVGDNKESSKETRQNLRQIPKKSRVCLRSATRSPRKPAKRNLSLFLGECSLKQEKRPIAPEMST